MAVEQGSVAVVEDVVEVGTDEVGEDSDGGAVSQVDEPVAAEVVAGGGPAGERDDAVLAEEVSQLPGLVAEEGGEADVPGLGPW